MNRVELAGLPGFLSIFDPVVDPLVSAGRKVQGVGQKVQEVVQSGVVQNFVSDAADVANFFTGRGQDPVQSLPSGGTQPTRTTTELDTQTGAQPRFQPRTSLVEQAKLRQASKSARLPLILGAGALAAVFLLRR